MASVSLTPESALACEPTSPADMAHRFTVDEYHQFPPLGESGTARTELLDGWIIDMTPVGPTHASVVGQAGDRLRPVVPSEWHVREEKPVTLPTSEPLPDLAVAKGKRGDYRKRHPGPKDIGLLIEVSDTTLALDRSFRAMIYAAAAIPHYWIITIPDRQLEVYSDPRRAVEGQPAFYAARRILRAGDKVSLILDGRAVAEIDVADLLP